MVADTDSNCVGGAPNEGDTAWILVSFLLVLGMVPGLAMFEAGLLRSKNTLSIITQIVTGIVVNGVMWVVIGFSLSFGPNDNPILGNWEHFFFIGVDSDTCSVHAPTVPHTAYAMFQMMFAVITPLLMTGAFAERFRFKAFVIFNTAWEILVYYPLAHWIFSTTGWLNNMGCQDFAGGIVIHTSAGAGSLVAAYLLGRREDFDENHGEFPPSNVPLTAIGTAMLWTGWFGFNAGSALSAGRVAASALTATQLAACTCGFITLLLRWWHGKPSTVGVLNGAVGGLAGITPAAGYVTSASALVLGVIFAVSAVYAGEFLKNRLRIDDALDVSVLHGLTGVIGSIAIGFCGSSHINPAGKDGLFNGGSGDLLGVQCLAVLVSAVWAGVWTFVIFRSIEMCGFETRATLEEEEKGLDLTDHGETAYHDLVLELAALKSDLPKHFRATTRRMNTISSSYMALGSPDSVGSPPPRVASHRIAEESAEDLNEVDKPRLPAFFSLKPREKAMYRLEDRE